MSCKKTLLNIFRVHFFPQDSNFTNCETNQSSPHPRRLGLPRRRANILSWLAAVSIFFKIHFKRERAIPFCSHIKKPSYFFVNLISTGLTTKITFEIWEKIRRPFIFFFEIHSIILNFHEDCWQNVNDHERLENFIGFSPWNIFKCAAKKYYWIRLGSISFLKIQILQLVNYHHE